MSLKKIIKISSNEVLIFITTDFKMHAFMKHQMDDLYPKLNSLYSFNFSGKSANHFKSATKRDVICTDKHPLL